MLNKNVAIFEDYLGSGDVNLIGDLLLRMPLVSREFINVEIGAHSLQSELILFGENGFKQLFNDFSYYLKNNFQMIFPGDISETINGRNFLKFQMYLQENLRNKISSKTLELILSDTAPFYFLYLVTKHQKLMQNDPDFQQKLHQLTADILDRLYFKDDLMGHSLSVLKDLPLESSQSTAELNTEELLAIDNTTDLIKLKDNFNSLAKTGINIKLPDNSILVLNKESLLKLHRKLIAAVDADQTAASFLKRNIKSLFLIMLDLQLKKGNRGALNTTLHKYQKKLNLSYESFVSSNELNFSPTASDKLPLREQEVSSISGKAENERLQPNFHLKDPPPPKNKSLFALLSIMLVGTAASVAAVRREPEEVVYQQIPEEEPVKEVVIPHQDILLEELQTIAAADRSKYRFLEPVEKATLFSLNYHFDQTLQGIYQKYFHQHSHQPEELYSQPVGANEDQIKNYELFFKELDSLYRNNISPLVSDNKLTPFWYDESTSYSYLPIETSFSFIRQYSQHHQGLSDLEAIKLSILINLYCEIVDLDPALVLGLMATESSFHPRAIGGLGEFGLGQILPANLATYGMSADNAYDLILNTRATVYHLYRGFVSWQKRTDDRELLAVASYNAGVGAIDKSLARKRNHHSINGYARNVLGLQQYLRE